MNVNVLKVFLILFLWGVMTVSTQAETTPLDLMKYRATNSLEEWQQHLKQELVNSQLTGQISIQMKQKSLLEWRHLDGQEPTLELFSNANSQEPKELYWLGSLSKQINAFVVIYVLKEHKIELDKSLQEILFPEVPEGSLSKDGQPITIRHLLNQTSGLTRRCSSYNQKYFLGQWALRECLRNQKPEYKPGSHYHYFNDGYNALALVVEKVTQKPFDEWRTLVLDKWGLYELKDSLEDIGKNSRLIEGKATLFSYAFNPFPLLMMHPKYYSGIGISGNLISHSSALHKWNYVFHQQIKYEYPVIYQTMTTSVLEDYGMGLVVEEEYFPEKKGRWYWHNGSLSPMGYSSFMAFLPEYQLSFVALSSRTHRASGVTQKSREILKNLMSSVENRESFSYKQAGSETAIWMVYLILYGVIGLLIRQFNQVDKSLPQITNIIWNISLCLYFLKETDYFFKREIFMACFILFWLLAFIVWGRYWILAYAQKKILVRLYFWVSIALWSYIFWSDKGTLMYFSLSLIFIFITLIPGHWHLRKFNHLSS